MRYRLLLIGLSLALGACAAQRQTASPTPLLLPLPSLTPIPAITTPIATPVIIASPTFTPTPVTYVVQKGDSLWSIAAKREIYGSATKWRRIFEANRDLLKTQDQVRVGMTLKIPRDNEDTGVLYGEEGVTFKK